MLRPRYRWSCPNCGGEAEAERLEEGLPCSACLPAPPQGRGVADVASALAARGALAGYAWLYALEMEYADFEEYFREKTGSSPWSAQRSWARRLLALESMAIIAPTGVGKTTLLTVYAAYRASRSGWRILYLTPTENLVRQVAARVDSLEPGVTVWYASSAGKRAREEALARLASGDYSIAVVTTGFLQRRMETLAAGAPFNLVIVDDVDSLLRNSRNVERVLRLLGYPQEAVEAALELVKARLSLYNAVASGREERARRLRERIAGLEAELRALGGPRGQLVIASATGRPRGYKHLVFRELLGFEVGGGSDYLRNVDDIYLAAEDPLAAVADVVERLGPGGIVFVSQAYGKAWARRLAAELESRGVPAALALSGGRRAVEKLARGDVWVVVGVASRYGVVVRGIDLPERVKYTVFLGAPGRLMRLEDALRSPRRLLRVLVYLADRGSGWAGEAASKLRRLLDKIPDPSIASAALAGRVTPEGGPLAELVELASQAAARAASELDAIVEAEGDTLVGAMVVERAPDGGLRVFIPDAPTYIQASGRASRLYKGVMTYGISVVVDPSPERVRALEARLSWTARAEFKPFNSVDVDEALRRAEETRKGKGRKVTVKSVLLVVESPTKARTIAWFWGRPSKRRMGRVVVYETSTVDPDTGTVYLLQVTATRGHIYDLAVDAAGSRHGVYWSDGSAEPVYTTVKRCLSCGYQYTEESRSCPRCGSEMVVDSSSVVEALRKLAVEVDEVVVATDPDREGEKIAWDVYLAVKPYNPRVGRGWFHEVTPEAVMAALRRPSPFKRRLIEAQVVRRIVDRWIGFTVSQHLWSVFGRRWLGAGRVQTPVLGWIIERYGEWRATRGYRVAARIEGWQGRLYFYAPDKAAALEAAEAGVVVVEGVDRSVEESSPPPPFTTDSLIYEAGRRLGYPAWLTMRLAQDLFESGLITYHRTDSTRVSPAGMGVARALLEKLGLSSLYRPRQWGEGGAHEAIRPTKPLTAEEVERAVLDGSLRLPVRLTRAHLRLYDLIVSRFLASQMEAALVERASARVRLGRLEAEVAGVSRVLREGYTAVYRPRMVEWLASTEAGARLRVVEARVYRASKVQLYRSGDVVRLMKERGIGRPSTYSKAIEANKRHGYVVESKRAGYLVPTRLGIEVYSYLSERFGDVVSEETSRRLEESLEAVEAGVVEPVAVLEDAWRVLEDLLAAASATQAGAEAVQ